MLQSQYCMGFDSKQGLPEGSWQSDEIASYCWLILKFNSFASELEWGGGRRDGSAGKGTWCQTWLPELSPQDPPGGRKELPSPGYPLVSTGMPYNASMPPK